MRLERKNVKLYPGDMVTTNTDKMAIIREIVKDRAKIHIDNNWTWVWVDDLRWTGICLEKLPKTNRGWRKKWNKICK